LVLIVCLAGAFAAQGQTPPAAPAQSKPATAAAASKPASAQAASKPATAKAASAPAGASKSATAAAAGSGAGFPAVYKLPDGVKRNPGIQKPVFAVKYQDLLIGKGPLGESNKMWHVKYKGWRATDGVVFDSWEDHKQPVRDKDGKPVMGPDNKPKMGDPEPMAFPQGAGRLIPGFDYGLEGMHVGGKRRIFIPWQAAYGTRNIPDRPDHPGIPAKSDLIFDVELVEVTDMPAPPPMPPGRGMPPRPGQPGAQPNPGAPGAPPKPATPSPATAPATPGNAPATATPPPASQPSAPPATVTPPPAAAPSTQPTPPPATAPKPQ
jgi:peptidylprolyl isomerase